MDIWAKLEQYRENGFLEAKEALGGLPESLWESYCAFANTKGGVILLGVGENPDKSLRILNLPDTDWLLEDFYTILNDSMKISVNLLTREDVQVIRENGKCIIAIFVPEARPHQKPVHLANDPWRHTYRRVGEADKRCSPEEVMEMMRKFVFFDTNSAVDSPGIYPISELAVLDKGLSEGDRVTAYMLGEQEYWDARVLRYDGHWCVTLLSEPAEMSRDRYAGQKEGFDEGMLCQKNRALRVLESLNLPEEWREEAVRRMMAI